METTPGSKLKWSFWQVVFLQLNNALYIVCASAIREMILQGLNTYNCATVNVEVPEHPPNYPQDFLGDLVWSGVPIIDPRKTCHTVGHSLSMNH